MPLDRVLGPRSPAMAYWWNNIATQCKDRSISPDGFHALCHNAGRRGDGRCISYQCPINPAHEEREVCLTKGTWQIIDGISSQMHETDDEVITAAVRAYHINRQTAGDRKHNT